VVYCDVMVEASEMPFGVVGQVTSRKGSVSLGVVLPSRSGTFEGGCRASYCNQWGLCGVVV